LRSRRMRLQLATHQDATWLHRVLRKASRRFGSRIDLDADGHLLLHR
jgi:hypothetical protein